METKSVTTADGNHIRILPDFTQAVSRQRATFTEERRLLQGFSFWNILIFLLMSGKRTISSFTNNMYKNECVDFCFVLLTYYIISILNLNRYIVTDETFFEFYVCSCGETTWYKLQVVCYLNVCSSAPPSFYFIFFVFLLYHQAQGTCVAVSSEPPPTGHRDEAVALCERST